QVWDMRAVLRFTLIMGPLSSLFDLATFYLLYAVFHADPAMFRTAWFVESIATQVLVIFIIRTSKPIWASRPHWVPTATALGALALALGLALSPLGRFAGFTSVTPNILAAIAVVTLVYLIAAEGLKRIAMKPMRARRRRAAQ
ncbi:MAG: Cation-transporting ATPase, partial [Hyphomicrobiales bacterium]|nr:Cation-transporting ATPase [Hyphomicrobiales bacterium]